MTDATTDFSLRRYPQFLRFWSGRVASAAGNQMLMVAVGWHMYDITNSAWDLGLIGLCQFLPALVLTLPAGHAADHGHRGRILAICMAVQALTGIGLTVAEFGHWVDRNLLLYLSVALGTARAFQAPAQQALVPLLVPAKLLPKALAFSSTGMQLAVIGGPALGGLIYVAGAYVVYAICALLFAASAGLFMSVRHRHVPPPKEPVT